MVAALAQRSAQNMSILTMTGVLLQMGLGIAAEYVLEIGIEAIWERVQHIAGTLRQQLQQLKGATVQDRGRLLCGIVSFTMVRLLSLSSHQTTVRYLWLAKVQSVQHTSTVHTAHTCKQHCNEILASLHCRTGKYMHMSCRTAKNCDSVTANHCCMTNICEPAGMRQACQQCRLRPHCCSATYVCSKLQEGKRPEDVKQALKEKNINVSISPANSTLLDFSQRGLTQVLRASVHYYNTEEEVHRFIEALKTLCL